MIILDMLDQDKWLESYDFFKDFRASTYYRTLLETYKNLNTQILYKSKIHGQGHIERVILFSMLLAYKYGLNKNDTDILRYAASLHDTKRIDDSYDTEHGYRAAIDSISYANVEKKDIKILQAVLAVHSRVDEKMNETIEEFFVEDFSRAKRLAKFFKDADGLDRVRIKDLDERYLRNDFSKEMVDFAKDLFKFYRKREDEKEQ